MPPTGWIEADSVAPRGTKEWRQQVVRNRQAVGNAAWQAQAQNNLNLSDPEALSSWLASQGFKDERGGGRHMRNLFMGNLPSEGFGMSSPERGISMGLEAYMPDWKRWHDRALQNGKPRGVAEQAFFPWNQGGTNLGNGGEPAPYSSAATFNAPTTTNSMTGNIGSVGASSLDELKKKYLGTTLGSL
jgi:hypothetical protein